MATSENGSPTEQNQKEERFRAMTAPLKETLKNLADTIYTNDDFSVKTVNRVLHTLTSLDDCKRWMKFDHKLTTKALEEYPAEFICPLSGNSMFNPVVIASGKTFELSAIENWLKEGNRTCPVTGIVLPHTYHTPNNLVREMNIQYCQENYLRHPGEKESKENSDLNRINRQYLNKLQESFDGSHDNLDENSKSLRYMTNKYGEFRTLFHTSDVIQKMLIPLSQLTGTADRSNPIYENLITTIYNISTHPDCKKLIVQYPTAIQVLMESLTCGSIGTRLSATGALYLLSIADINDNINKKILGQAGVLKPLIKVLEEGHPLTVKVAADAILSLCEDEDNKDIAIGEGIVKVILKKLRIYVLVDELLAILSMLTTRKQARDEMWDENAPSLMKKLVQVVAGTPSIPKCLYILKAFASHQEENRERERKAAENAINEQIILQQNAADVLTESLEKVGI